MKPVATENGSPIVLCEPQCWGLEHAHFNASLLATALLAYPVQPVVFMGEKGHLNSVRDVLGEFEPTLIRRVEWRELKIPVRQTYGWSRLPRELPWVRAVFRVVSGGSKGRVVLCSITSTGLVALKLVKYLNRATVPVLAVMHGVLKTAFDKRSLRPSSWLVNMRDAMVLPHPRNLRYVTLGASLLRSLRAAAPRTARHFVSLELPYLMHDLPDEEAAGTRRKPEVIRFGFLGFANAVKRFDLFARLADETRARLPGAPAEFTLVGQLINEHDASRFPLVTGLVAHPLTPDEYERRASALTYVVSTADPVHYRLLGSATFLDSLAFGKPGIFVRTPFLEFYFSEMGDIGYLCDSYEELLETILGIVREFPEQRYREQCRNIRKHREHFSPHQLAPQMREAMRAT
jgi:hypothetical protein